MNVFQHLDELKDSDGVGNDAIGLSEVFNSLGYKSHFITRQPRKGKTLNSEFHLTNHFQHPTTSNDIHILHYGGAGYPYELFQNLPGKKILRFHNVTPAIFYKDTTTPDIHLAMSKFESLSYLEIATLSIISDSIWCDSEFNLQTVSEYQFKNPYILPICKSYDINSKSEDLSRNHSLVFVGRYSPQKKWEDLIELFSYWVKEFPDARCKCIGSVIGAFDGYFEKLTEKVRSLDLNGKVEFLTGKTDQEVISILKEAGAFVSMSEHEGFCLPILEAFGAGIPVFAYAAGAIPETMRGAGILLKTKEYPSIIQIMKDNLFQLEKRTSLISEQYKVLESYNKFPFQEEISKILSSGIQ
ncbi:glycosyltransferase [Leptospira sp. 2 VSF19]|uniref:Glycosyltransferase n=1 Tax=Leptospira soteropolitanensis TaxID=2950025 RepID=A0AAW5VCG6_9LEPT|nr:glycosyltransferase [Leptospira soteropolitanensis]MCW7491341.1 glycosyltransferase [Leptospira soteropolitanensis]MCW7498926.1 glycosyltransferase [Leptospira soteropolitanensis]MCW7521482.1 glycosyltransferase [Leptospira soteropolitanensis]MCW7525029.1 glycosyltransferase [Leptospira soteropolitanensis]MCW7528897.1 glycosyltransferase [Leptospira soteropolitanensis]